MTDSAPALIVSDADLIAYPDAGYRWKHLIVAVVMIAAGGWFAYDGWVHWPRDNQRIIQVQQDHDQAQAVHDQVKVEEYARELSQLSRHTDLDIAIQKGLAGVLPVIGLIWAGWTLQATRGRYLMTADTLTIPGHPPLRAEHIRRIDKRNWDRKGIAYLHYEFEDKPGVVKVDDFAYERGPTDQILERIERNVLPPVPPQAEITPPIDEPVE